jgi:hypothetical protein
VLVAVDYRTTRGSSGAVLVGAEFEVLKMVALRLGSKGRAGGSDATIGLGLTIKNLTLTVYPYRIGTYEYIIDFFYTTQSGPLSPSGLLVVPFLTGMILVAYVILRKGLSYAVPEPQDGGAESSA